MAVTIIGSLSIATAGQEDVHTVSKAALGCNLAWGLVDAIMYLLRTMTERSHIRVLAKQHHRRGRRYRAASDNEGAAGSYRQDHRTGRDRGHAAAAWLDCRPVKHAILRPRDYLEAARRIPPRRDCDVSGRRSVLPDEQPGNGASRFASDHAGHALACRICARALRRARETAAYRADNGRVRRGADRCGQGAGRMTAVPPRSERSSSLASRRPSPRRDLGQTGERMSAKEMTS